MAINQITAKLNEISKKRGTHGGVIDVIDYNRIMD